MKIYFAGSIRGGRDDKDIYLQIIKILSKYGQVLTEHIGDVNLTGMGEQKYSDEYIFVRDLNWLKEADLIVAEVTNPSLGVGYEIGIAESLDKNIICLFRSSQDRKLSAMIGGNKKVKVIEYKDLNDIEELLKENI